MIPTHATSDSTLIDWLGLLLWLGFLWIIASLLDKFDTTENRSKLWSFLKRYRKKVVLLVYAFAVTYISLFNVPWILERKTSSGYVSNFIVKYKPIWESPAYDSYYNGIPRLGTNRILIELIAISIITGVAYKLVCNRKENS